MTLEQVKSCNGKRPRTRENAIRKAEGFGAPVIPYRCGFCEFWHVGHNLKDKLFYTNREYWERVNS